MNNKNLCKKYSKNVRVHIENNFTNDMVNKQTLNLYKKIISKKSTINSPWKLVLREN